VSPSLTARCHGMDGARDGAAGARARFELPGDRPVWGRDRPFRVEHLHLELEFDVARREVHGVATTRFHARHDGLAEAVFDANELEVESVTTGDGRRLDFTVRDRELRVALGAPQVVDEPCTLVVRYRCRPRRGLYFNAPDEAYPGRPTQIWTQGQPEDSPYYFPCLDFPGEKFTTEVTVTVSRGWTVVSNGRLESVNEDARRRRATFHWVQDVPHPAYLVTLVAGEFEVVEDRADGVRVQYYGPKGSAAEQRRAWGRTPEMIRFFSQRIGVPYPWSKYATVSVADFIFGGMENTSATTMVDTYLHDERAHEDMREPSDSLAAHELAHQWFGDLLTCREWSHGWLNESFATYFDALYVEHARGWDAFRHDVWQKARDYLDEDESHYRRPLVENVFHDPIDIFDSHLYERGAVVLDMLRWVLGDQGWWRAIQHYVQKHRTRDVLTHDLQRAIEEATGRNVDWFFDQWVWKGGHPELKASYSWDGERRLATVHLTQTQKVDDLTALFRTPIEIGFMTAHGFERHVRELSEVSHTFAFHFDAEPVFVSIDPAWRVLKTLDFSPGEGQLRERLVGDPEAMGRIEAARALGKIATPRALDALCAVLLNDRELPFVRAAAAAALGDSKAEAALAGLVEAVGVEPSRVRRAVMRALGNFRDPRAAKALSGALQRRGDASYYVQADAATALGKTRDATAVRALTRVLGRPAHNDVITAGALTGLGETRDPAALPALLEHTRWGVHQNARRAAAAGLASLAPYCEAADRVRIRERLEELVDDRWTRVQRAAIEGLEHLRDPAALPALERLAARTIDGRARRAARVAARRIEARADRAQDVRSLNDEVEKLRQQNRELKDRLASIEGRLDALADGAGAPADNGRGNARTPSRSARATKGGGARGAKR